MVHIFHRMRWRWSRLFLAELQQLQRKLDDLLPAGAAAVYRRRLRRLTEANIGAHSLARSVPSESSRRRAPGTASVLGPLRCELCRGGGLVDGPSRGCRNERKVSSRIVSVECEGIVERVCPERALFF